MKHDVLIDVAGWGNHPRLTCYGDECGGATLVRAPYMTEGVWATAKEQFMAVHPSEVRSS